MLFIQVLRHLIAINVTINHKEVLIKTIKNAEKQASVQERLNFLTQCRRNNLIPNFIKSSVRATEKIFRNSRTFERRRDNFHRELLNEAIQATHRTKAFLHREAARLSTQRSYFGCSLTRWVEYQAHSIFRETAATCHQRLKNKFAALINCMKEQTDQPRQHQPERLKNLSDVTPSGELANLLEKGPKFALSQTITEKTLRDVEIGIEKALNAIRWKEFWSQRTPTAPAANSFPFLPPRGNQAPKAGPSSELDFSLLKKRVLSTYKNHKSGCPNHTKEQRTGLKMLKKNDDVIVKASDKCKGIVILNKSDYIEKATAITSEYEEVDKNPTSRIEAETKRIIKETLDGKLEDSQIQALLPQNSRTAELYGLPKDHKPGVPLRPIVSACGDPLDKISQLLEKILGQLLQFIPAHLSSTDEYLRRLSDAYPGRSLPPGTILFSVDVTNLYGNIPYEEATDSARRLLEAHHEDINMFGLEVPDVIHLLKHCLSNNFLRFGDRYYRQTRGIAMGSRVAPPLAIIFMGSLEELYNDNAAQKPDLYMRYIDDILGVWTHGSASLREYFSHINAAHPTIKFTIESTEETSSIPFLDTKITIKPAGNYTTELYIKPMSAGVILHADSAQPWQTKRAVLHSQIRRAIKISSDSDSCQRSIDKVKQLFLNNGYSMKTINTAIDRCRSSARQDKRKKKTSVTRLVLPFIDDQLAKAVQAVIRGSGQPDVSVTWTNQNTIKRQLVRSALKTPPCPGGSRCHSCAAGLQGRCHSSGVVYQLTCELCHKIYIGETGRPVRLRYNEHLRDAKNQRQDSPWGDHFRREHPRCRPEPKHIAATILQVCNSDSRDRKIAEALWIRRHHPELNNNIAAWTVL